MSNDLYSLVILGYQGLPDETVACNLSLDYALLFERALFDKYYGEPLAIRIRRQGGRIYDEEDIA